MLLQRFLYDLAGLHRPKSEELDEEINRLLYIETAEKPTFLVSERDRDPLSNLDSEVMSQWLSKKFKPALLQLLLGPSDNYHEAKRELNQMDRYKTLVDRALRAYFVGRHSEQIISDYHFAENTVPSLQHTVADLKKLLNLISDHLSQNSPQTMTLFNTEAYTSADVTLYNFLKRIMVGKYRDYGLSSHIKMSDSLVKFMRNYASKNQYVIDVSHGDPLAGKNEEPGLIADIVKPATICLGLVLFYVWSKR